MAGKAEAALQDGRPVPGCAAAPPEPPAPIGAWEALKELGALEALEAPELGMILSEVAREPRDAQADFSDLLVSVGPRNDTTHQAIHQSCFRTYFYECCSESHECLRNIVSLDKLYFLDSFLLYSAG